MHPIALDLKAKYLIHVPNGFYRETFLEVSFKLSSMFDKLWCNNQVVDVN